MLLQTKCCCVLLYLICMSTHRMQAATISKVLTTKANAVAFPQNLNAAGTTIAKADAADVEGPKFQQKYIIKPIDNTADLNESVTFVYDEVNFADRETNITVTIQTESDENTSATSDEFVNATTIEIIEATTKPILIKNNGFETTNVYAAEEIEMQISTKSTDLVYKTNLISLPIGDEINIRNSSTNIIVNTASTRTNSNENIFENSIIPMADNLKAIGVEYNAISRENDQMPTTEIQFNKTEILSETTPNYNSSEIFDARQSTNKSIQPFIINVPPTRRQRPQQLPLDIFGITSSPLNNTPNTTARPASWFANLLPQLFSLPAPPARPTLFLGPYGNYTFPNRSQSLFGLGYLMVPPRNTTPTGLLWPPPWNFTLFPQRQQSTFDGNTARHGLFFNQFYNQSKSYNPFFKHKNKTFTTTTTTEAAIRNNFGQDQWILTKPHLNIANNDGQIMHVLVPMRKQYLQSKIQPETTAEFEEIVETEQIIEVIDNAEEIVEVIRRRRPKPRPRPRPSQQTTFISVRQPSRRPAIVQNKIQPIIQVGDDDNYWAVERSGAKLAEVKAPQEETKRDEPPETSSFMFEVAIPKPVHKFMKMIFEMFSG